MKKNNFNIKEFIRGVVKEQYEEIGANNFMEALKLNSKNILRESSLSRMWQFVEEDKNFGVISPFRNEYSKEQNLQRYKELKTKVREAGYGFVELRGGFNEEGTLVEELSLFIPNVSKKDIINWGKEYDQYSIIYKDDKEFVEIGTNKFSGVGKILNSFAQSSGKENITLDKNKTNDFYSSLAKGSHRGRKFLFNLKESFLLEKVQLSFNEIAYSKKKINKDESWIIIF